MRQIEEQEDKTEAKRMWRSAGDIGSVGLEIGFSVVIGFLGGNWLDGKFGTSPYLGLIGLLLGVGAAGNALWRTARKLNKDQDQTS